MIEVKELIRLLVVGALRVHGSTARRCQMFDWGDAPCAVLDYSLAGLTGNLFGIGQDKSEPGWQVEGGSG